MEADKFYHIYNRTNANELLFRTDDNHRYFLKQFRTYIGPIANIYAYCLLPNHFHFLLQIKGEEELKILFKEKLSKGFKPLESLISLQFGHFFNSYTQAFNKVHQRKGSLFTPNFKRKAITSEEYLRQLIIYIHLNPVKHGVTEENFKYVHKTKKLNHELLQSVIDEDD